MRKLKTLLGKTLEKRGPSTLAKVASTIKTLVKAFGKLAAVIAVAAAVSYASFRIGFLAGRTAAVADKYIEQVTLQAVEYGYDQGVQRGYSLRLNKGA
jgi:hypothetical protein